MTIAAHRPRQLALRNYGSHRKCPFPAAGDEGLLRRPKFLSSRARQLAGWVGLLLSEAEGLERAPGDVILDIGPPYECTAFSPGRAPSDGIQGNLASGLKMIVRRDVQRGK